MSDQRAVILGAAGFLGSHLVDRVLAEGWRVTGVDNLVTCQDAREVPALLSQRPFGLVLLDLNMPHLSGEELLERIRAEHPEVTVIVISGMNQVETAVRCVKLGAAE